MMIKNYELRIKRVKVSEPEAAYIGAKVTGPETVTHVARHIFGDSAQEHFAIFHLDSQHSILGYTEAARGGITNCPVDISVVLRAALTVGASAIIAVHNHPSGNVAPSAADKQLTKRLQAACELVGVAFLDHVIVTDASSFSFAGHQLL